MGSAAGLPRRMLLEPNEMISASHGSRRRRTFWLRWYGTSPPGEDLPNGDEPSPGHSAGELIAGTPVSSGFHFAETGESPGVDEIVHAIPSAEMPLALNQTRQINGAVTEHAISNEAATLVRENRGRHPKSVVDCLSELAAILEATPHPDRERCLRLVRHCQQAVHGSDRANRAERSARRPR
ncbi:MAG: hypothetical protein KF777_12245 [Planctomycetaceae bacterium]|nr:hypothetical protein [Planctomycetaceae bacterium]